MKQVKKSLTSFPPNLLGFYSKNKDKKNKFCQKKEVKNTNSTWWRKQRQHNNWTLEQTLTNLATKSTMSYWRHVIASVNFDNIFHEVHFLKRNLYYASNIPCKSTMWYYILKKLFLIAWFDLPDLLCFYKNRKSNLVSPRRRSSNTG